MLLVTNREFNHFFSSQMVHSLLLRITIQIGISLYFFSSSKNIEVFRIKICAQQVTLYLIMKVLFSFKNELERQEFSECSRLDYEPNTHHTTKKARKGLRVKEDFWLNIGFSRGLDFLSPTSAS